MSELSTSKDREIFERENTPEFKHHNLEYDLRSTQWIVDKVRANESYAQNLYAAMCNNDFVKNEVWPILQGQTWSCSWRYAGGIVAHMRAEGDYMNWYCSGIRDTNDPTEDEWNSWSNQEQLNWTNIYSKFVNESVVTDEIKEDLLKLGWQVLPSDYSDS